MTRTGRRDWTELHGGSEKAGVRTKGGGTRTFIRLLHLEEPLRGGLLARWVGLFVRVEDDGQLPVAFANFLVGGSLGKIEDRAVSSISIPSCGVRHERNSLEVLGVVRRRACEDPGVVEVRHCPPRERVRSRRVHPEGRPHQWQRKERAENASGESGRAGTVAERAPPARPGPGPSGSAKASNKFLTCHVGSY